MEVGVKVKGKIIEGDLQGTRTSWKFNSNDEYFIQHFPSHFTDSDFFLKLYSKDNPINDVDTRDIYDEVIKTARFFLDAVPDVFTDKRYNSLFKIAEQMSVENKIHDIAYVCAPVDKEALRTFQEKYFPNQTKNFRPFYRQEIAIYEVRTSNVPYSDEIEYSFNNIYGKSIFVE